MVICLLIPILNDGNSGIVFCFGPIIALKSYCVGQGHCKEIISYYYRQRMWGWTENMYDPNWSVGDFPFTPEKSNQLKQECMNVLIKIMVSSRNNLPILNLSRVKDLFYS